jgi:hypothetical protein
MKWFNRTAQGFDVGIATRTFCAGKTELRRSEVFIDNRSPNRRELCRSGISRRVDRPAICKTLMVRCDRSDVAPTELATIFLCRCYKDAAPTELGATYLPRRYKDFAATELFLIKKSFLHTLQKDFSDLHKHESRTC